MNVIDINRTSSLRDFIVIMDCVQSMCTPRCLKVDTISTAVPLMKRTVNDGCHS